MNKLQWLATAAMLGGGIGLAASCPLTLRTYAIETSRVEQEVRLGVVSDLHGIVYGEGQRRLLEKIKQAKPDAILLPGDIVDDKISWEGSWELLRSLGKRYLCYFSAGNHEFRIAEVAQLKELIRAYGVQVLEGDVRKVCLQGQTIAIGGYDNSQFEPYESDWEAQRERCFAQRPKDCFSVLLCHRPEYTADFRHSGYDLVVSGHAHGGQWRLPGVINGLYAPGQGIFPQYAGGRYELGKTKLVVSRGLRQDWMPRIFNPPEVVLVRILPRK